MKTIIFLLFVHVCFFTQAQEQIISDSFGCKYYYDDLLGVNVYTYADEFPKKSGVFIGSSLSMFIFKNLRIPPQDQHQYSVFLYFIISPEGCPVRAWEPKKLEEEYTPLEKSVIELICSMPRCTPAKCDGVPVYFRLPIPLKLNYD